MKSDKEYIEKVIKNYERRKKLAAIFGVIGILFGAATFMLYLELDNAMRELISSFSAMLSEGETITENDIKLMKASYEISYFGGLRAGQTLNSLSAVSGLSLGYSLYLLFWARKEKIIKELYEKTKI